MAVSSGCVGWIIFCDLSPHRQYSGEFTTGIWNLPKRLCVVYTPDILVQSACYKGIQTSSDVLATEKRHDISYTACIYIYTLYTIVPTSWCGGTEGIFMFSIFSLLRLRSAVSYHDMIQSAPKYSSTSYLIYAASLSLSRQSRW